MEWGRAEYFTNFDPGTCTLSAAASSVIQSPPYLSSIPSTPLTGLSQVPVRGPSKRTISLIQSQKERKEEVGVNHQPSVNLWRT